MPVDRVQFLEGVEQIRDVVVGCVVDEVQIHRHDRRTLNPRGEAPNHDILDRVRVKHTKHPNGIKSA